MKMLQELIALGKKCNILYVEDDKALQTETKKMLERIFEKVYTADNGAEGDRLFSETKIDIVLTDIEMPIMNGLKMSELIKARAPECPIVVLSAYSSDDYFMEAIENSVDHYVLKPVNSQKLLDTFLKVCKRLEDQRLLQEYKEMQLKQQIENEKLEMLSEVSNSSPNPMLVYSDGKLLFINKVFEKYFAHDTLNEKISNEKGLEDYFNERIVPDQILNSNDILSKEFVIADLANSDRKIALMSSVGKKIFKILMSPLNLQDKNSSVLYTMNDITELIYQQMQLEMFSEKLSETIEENFVKKQPKNEGIINKVEF